MYATNTETVSGLDNHKGYQCAQLTEIYISRRRGLVLLFMFEFYDLQYVVDCGGRATLVHLKRVLAPFLPSTRNATSAIINA
jgi:hypothetical protein